MDSSAAFVAIDIASWRANSYDTSRLGIAIALGYSNARYAGYQLELTWFELTSSTKFRWTSAELFVAWYANAIWYADANRHASSERARHSTGTGLNASRQFIAQPWSQQRSIDYSSTEQYTRLLACNSGQQCRFSIYRDLRHARPEQQLYKFQSSQQFEPVWTGRRSIAFAVCGDIAGKVDQQPTRQQFTGRLPKSNHAHSKARA